MQINRLILKDQFKYFFLLLISVFFVFPFLDGVKDEVMMISCVFFTIIVFTFRLLAIRMRYIVFFLIKRDGKGLRLSLAQQNMARLANIQGFTPIILEIKPAVASSI